MEPETWSISQDSFHLPKQARAYVGQATRWLRPFGSGLASPLDVRLHTGSDSRPCAAFKAGFCLLRGSFPFQHPLHKLCDYAIPVGLQL